MGHKVLMRSTLTYNATYILEDCTLEAKFHHKYRNDRDRELSLVIKMYYYLARRSLCEIINSTLGMLIHRWIGGTLFRTCITLKSKQRESGASESPCFSQMHSEMRLSMFLQKEMT